MKKIHFFNHYHKGDVFCTRPFVEQVIKNLQEFNVEFLFHHNYDEYLLKDVPVKTVSINQIPSNIGTHSANCVVGDDIYINTWIGKYFNKSKLESSGCNLRTLCVLVYSEIFDFINCIFGTDIKLSNTLDYFPTINYSYFNISKIDDFVTNNNKQKILFCNGPALSGQCMSYNGDMGDIILPLAEKYNDYLFIVTHNLNSSQENVIYTGDIIQQGDNDLNEISYLSTKCNVIVGRSSGPFTFSNVKENILDLNKKFLCFGVDRESVYPYDLDVNIECEYMFEIFTNPNNLKNSIEAML